MLFSSPIFFGFFLLYFLFQTYLPTRWRIYLIIVGSTIFYGWWKPEYVWIPYLLMSIAYFGYRWMEQAVTPIARKRRLLTTIVILFLPLAFFKYTNFFYGVVVAPFNPLSVKLIDLPLPLGVSFVTFTLTAFVVDVYRRKFPATASARTVLAYVLFFPHLIAGPILRPDELIPQLERPRRRPLIPMTAIAIFTVGLIKKLVFADQIAELVDAIYNRAGIPSGPEALLAIYGFSVQIYCDFSGYTDMAIGLALLLGVRLPNNFAQPYCAGSIIEFWRRWHITLSFWLRDYLYIPLGGNRRGRWRELANIVITMALGGLWHGANWTFVIWGVVHGSAVACLHAVGGTDIGRWIGRMPGILSAFLTFHFVGVAWILFRAPDLNSGPTNRSSSFCRGLGGLPGDHRDQFVYRAAGYDLLGDASLRRPRPRWALR